MVFLPTIIIYKIETSHLILQGNFQPPNSVESDSHLLIEVDLNKF
jgi:hypothetical protein